ncbi:MAG: iron ABC transporter permease [Candidatus Rokubacteria bacterium]|nr:iron ABC transporter permease [Candidatus Rokubacteria bacterium]
MVWLTPEKAIKVVIGVAASAMVLGPVATLIHGSLSLEDPSGRTVYSVENYVEVLTDDRIREAVLTTLAFTLGATGVAALFGIPLAWLTARTDMPARRPLDRLYLLPFFISSFQGAIAWKFLASPKIGILNGLLVGGLGLTRPPLDIHTVGGMAFVEGLFLTPIMYLFAKATLAGMDPRLEESSRVAGFGVLQTARRITLPLAAPGIVSALLLIFVTAAGSLAVPLFLGAPVRIKTLSTQIFEILAFRPDYGKASAVSLVLVTLTLAGWLGQQRATRGQRFVTITGKSYAPRVIPLGRWRWAALAFCLGFLTLTLVLPIATLVLVSASRVWTGRFDPSLLTAHHYRAVFASEVVRRAIVNTLLISTVGATLAVGIGIVLAHAIHRSRSRLGGPLDFVVTMPIAFGGVVIGVGVLLTYIHTPIYGTVWIIVAGLLTRFEVFALRPISSVLLAIDPELEESARVGGASFFRMLRDVLYPLLKPGIVSAWLIVFIIFMREFDIASLLYAHQSVVMSVAIYIFSELEPSPAVAALALVQAVIILAATYVFMKLTGGRGVAF